MLSRTRRAHLRRSFAPEALESRTLLSISTGSLAEALFTTSYAALQLRPALSSERQPRAQRAGTSQETTTFATQGLALVQQSTPPTFLQSLSVVSNADGTSAAIIDYQGTELGTYTASARWDNGPAEAILVDQPGEFWHEPTVGSAYALRRGLGAGQHTLELTVTNADRHVSATTSAAFSIESITPDESAAADPYGPERIAGDGAFAPTDGFTVDSGESLAATETDPAPKVAAVYVRAPGWTTDFKNYLQTQTPSLGDATYGYAIPAGSDQLKTLPWTGLDTISVRFTENVTVRAEDLLVKGVNFADYALKPEEFTYDDTTFTATWKLQQAVANDKLLLHVTNFVTDSAGQRLDGEWSNGTTANFPSGDGAADGVFDFRLNVLPGDADRDSDVDNVDKADIKSRFFTTTTDPNYAAQPPYAPYSVFHDIDGSAGIFANDYSASNNYWGSTQPVAQPAVPSLPTAPTSPIAISVSGDQIDLSWTPGIGTVQFSEVQRSINGGTWSLANTGAPDVTSYSDAALPSGSSVAYRVVVAGEAGYSGWSSVVESSTAPGALDAASTSSNEVAITWQSTSSTGSVVIERSADGVSFTAVGSVSAATGVFNDAGVSPGRRYYYRSRLMFDSTTYSAYSDRVLATTPAAIPAQPTGLTATAAPDGTLNITWQDNSDNEAGFRIDRLVGDTILPGASYQPIGDVNANTTSFQFLGAQPQEPSFIRVQSYNRAGLSDPAVFHVAESPLSTPSNLTAEFIGGNVNLAWDLPVTYAYPNNYHIDVERAVGTDPFTSVAGTNNEGVQANARFVTLNGQPDNARYRVVLYGSAAVTYSTPATIQSRSAPLDVRPMVWIERRTPQYVDDPVSDDCLSEADNGSITICRSGSEQDVSAPLTVYYTLDGDAIPGTPGVGGADYMIPGSTSSFRSIQALTIPAGAWKATLTIVPFADGVEEGLETVGIRLRAHPAYSIVTDPANPSSTVPGVGSISIFANDPKLDLVAHRTGGRFGEPVSEAVEDGGDPTSYVILTNNDYEEGTSFPDNSDSAALTGSGGMFYDDTQRRIDDDLARITLRAERYWYAMRQVGSYSLRVSNPASVRLLTDSTADLVLDSLNEVDPGNSSHDVDIWVEGLQPDPDLVLSFIFRNNQGQILAQDDIHMNVVDWQFVDTSGAATDGVANVLKSTLTDRAAGVGDAPAIPETALFKSHLTGLASGSLQELRVTSVANPADWFDDTIQNSGEALQSTRFAVLYYSNTDDDVLSSGERGVITSALSLNAVHNETAEATLTTQGGDQQSKKQVLNPRQLLLARLQDEEDKHKNTQYYSPTRLDHFFTQLSTIAQGNSLKVQLKTMNEMKDATAQYKSSSPLAGGTMSVRADLDSSTAVHEMVHALARESGWYQGNDGATAMKDEALAYGVQYLLDTAKMLRSLEKVEADPSAPALAATVWTSAWNNRLGFMSIYGLEVKSGANSRKVTPADLWDIHGKITWDPAISRGLRFSESQLRPIYEAFLATKGIKNANGMNIALPVMSPGTIPVGDPFQ